MTWKMKCPALGCNNDHRQNKDLMWHRFPLRRPLLLAKWTVRLKPGINYEHRRLCCIHFHKECYVGTNDEQKPLKLKRNAFPTMFEGETIEREFLLDESQANVEDKSVPPTTVRKRDVEEYKKKKELQQRQQFDGNLDLDGNLAYQHNEGDEIEDDENLLLGDIKLGQSPLMHDSPSQALHQLRHKEPSNLLSMAQHSFEPSSSSEQPGNESSFFNAMNDNQFSPPQERQNNFDDKALLEQFMAGTLEANTGGSSIAQPAAEPTTLKKAQLDPTSSSSTRSSRGGSGQQLTGAAKRKAAHVTRLGTSSNYQTRSASSDVSAPQQQQKATLTAPHMKKTNSVSSNSGSSSPNSPLSGGGNGALPVGVSTLAVTGGDSEMNARSFDSGAGIDKSAAHALANAFMQNPSLAASFGTQFLSAMASANNNHSGNSSSLTSSVAGSTQHYAGRHSIATVAEQQQPKPTSAKRKSTATNLQQSRPSKTVAVQNTQNEMMPPIYSSSLNNGITTRSPNNNMQLVQQVYNVLQNSIPNGFNNSNNMSQNNRPNLHTLANNLASVVSQNTNTQQFSNNNNNYTAAVHSGNVDRREFDRLAREVDMLRRELAAKDNELRELRSNAASNGGNGKQPAFALIPLGATNVSLVSLARFLQTCGGSSSGNGANDTEISGDDSADDNQFEIQEMQCPLVSVSGPSNTGNNTITNNGGYRGVHGPNSNNFHHNMQHNFMPSSSSSSSVMNGIEQHTLTGYEIKH